LQHSYFLQNYLTYLSKKQSKYKLKYLQSALNASIKYLGEEDLKDPVQILLQEHLSKLKAAGFRVEPPVTSAEVTQKASKKSPEEKEGK
jgi:hypothetical protein